VKWNSKNERIDRIFREMKSINIDTHFNSIAILFRSYLDMVVYQYLQKNSGIKDILSLEQQRLDEEIKNGNGRLRAYVRTFGVADARILDKDLKKALRYRGTVSPDWVPSLKHMLVHLSQSELLLPDNKLRQALSGYVKGNSEYLSHNDFNLLVHNEYYIRSPHDLKTAWDQMQPILAYINQQLAR
jgi:hypothetical protein